LYVDALVHALAAHLLQHYSRGREASGRLLAPPEWLVPRRIRRVTDYIRANLAADLTIDELAGHAGLSSFHFARVFRRETGETPHQFVTRLRLEEAARLLRATDQTVLQIAIAVGFESASHFSVQFKRSYCVTPLAYRLHG
jgi:AraC family transcriptional regulator